VHSSWRLQEGEKGANVLLTESQILVAAPNDTNAIGLEKNDANEDDKDYHNQLLRRQFQQLLAPWQAMRLGNYAVDGLQVAQISSGGETVMHNKLQSLVY